MKLSPSQSAKLEKLTDFERAVLIACALIPKGQTRTYSQIASLLGRPRSARAVGNALAKNPLAPIIPCHRVVKGNGVGGYSAKGGIRKKMRLLKKESSGRK